VYGNGDVYGTVCGNGLRLFAGHELGCAAPERLVEVPSPPNGIGDRHMILSTHLLSIGTAGAAGGIVNALMTDNGFALPRVIKTETGTIVKPGVVGNMIVSAFAALLSWALYAADADLAASTSVALVRALGGAALVGLAGARWLTSEVDKKLRQATLEEIGRGRPDGDVLATILAAPPSEGLQIAEEASRAARPSRRTVQAPKSPAPPAS
jgi:hypothetical protein